MFLEQSKRNQSSRNLVYTCTAMYVYYAHNSIYTFIVLDYIDTYHRIARLLGYALLLPCRNQPFEIHQAKLWYGYI